MTPVDYVDSLFVAISPPCVCNQCPSLTRKTLGANAQVTTMSNGRMKRVIRRFQYI